MCHALGWSGFYIKYRNRALLRMPERRRAALEPREEAAPGSEGIIYGPEEAIVASGREGFGARRRVREPKIVKMNEDEFENYW